MREKRNLRDFNEWFDLTAQNAQMTACEATLALWLLWGKELDDTAEPCNAYREALKRNLNYDSSSIRYVPNGYPHPPDHECNLIQFKLKISESDCRREFLTNYKILMRALYPVLERPVNETMFSRISSELSTAKITVALEKSIRM